MYLLKPVAIAATSTWPYYHMVKTLGLSPATASLVYFIGGGVGLVGNPLGARLTNRWGRRPTSTLFTAIAITSGVAFYYVPNGTGALAPLLAAATRPGGHVLLSGILPEQCAAVADAYSPWYALASPVLDEGWALLTGRRR